MIMYLIQKIFTRKGYSNLISTWISLYRNSTEFWASILEERSSVEDEYEQSKFLDKAFLIAYTKNDLLIKNI